jgi:hypothetical protein
MKNFRPREMKDFSHDLSGKPVISGNNVTVKNKNTASDDPLAKAVEEQKEDVEKNELKSVGNQETNSKNESNDTSAKVGEEQTGDLDENMEANSAASSGSDSESESETSDESTEDESERTSDAESDKDDDAQKTISSKTENASNVFLPAITSNQDIKNDNSKTDQSVTSSKKNNQDLNESRDESKNMVTIESLKKELQTVAGSGTKRAASNTSTPEKQDVETREENKVRRDKKKSKAAAEKKPGGHI